MCAQSLKTITNIGHKEDTDKRVSKDMAHYLTRGINKGSKEETALRIQETKNITEEREIQITKSINNPKYIIWDSETDTSSGVHRPDLIIAHVLEVDDTHNYEKSLLSTHMFERYNCVQEFCLWLFKKGKCN